MREAPLRCLVVEDEEADRLMFKRVFSHLSHRCSADFADSLAHARQMLMDQSYSLIVLDNTLQDGNGADFVLELLGSKRLSSTSIVIVSDWPSPFMYAKVQSKSVLSTLTKSQFDTDNLRNLLALAQQRANPHALPDRLS